MMTIASMIHGVSIFNLGYSNMKNLKGKETDRIKKMSENLKAFDIKTIVTKNSMKIYGSASKIYTINKQI